MLLLHLMGEDTTFLIGDMPFLKPWSSYPEIYIHCLATAVATCAEFLVAAMNSNCWAVSSTALYQPG